jgi:NAD(P)H-dependent flavin oxidoreductase YrpB (nitropropane dioxygenase family)
VNSWPDRRILDLLRVELPIVLAPMTRPGTADLAIAVSEAGGLGSLLGFFALRATGCQRDEDGTGNYASQASRPINPTSSVTNRRFTTRNAISLGAHS